MSKLKSVDLSQKSFTANGKAYFIENEISIQRSVYAEMAKLELEKGIRVGSSTDDWQKVYDLANAQKFADIAVLAYNNRRGFKDLLTNTHPILKLCACFINEENEDRRYISDDAVTKKVNDWAEEGFTMSGFFMLALTSLKEEVASYKSVTQTISEIIEELKTSESQNTAVTGTLN